MKSHVENEPTKESHFFHPSGKAIPKTKMYKWGFKDSPGEMLWIDKNDLFVDHTYQRDEIAETKILRLASAWSWVACGAICVGMRESDYMVIDGQHRVLAAKRRADIKELPCMVFEMTGIEEEARGFYAANVNRKAISAIDKYRAMLVGKDPLAIKLQQIFDATGVTLARNPTKDRQLKTADVCLRYTMADAARFERALMLSAELCDGVIPIHSSLIKGLWSLDGSCWPLTNKKFRNRILSIGAVQLLAGADKARAFYGKSSSAVLAKGMLTEINKGLHTKYHLKNTTESTEE